MGLKRLSNISKTRFLAKYCRILATESNILTLKLAPFEKELSIAVLLCYFMSGKVSILLMT